ncbi:MAG: hypothetical protein IKM37_08045 [Alistipes sp.]|nr:hypothetical protein [Alistipes sp.]
MKSYNSIRQRTVCLLPARSCEAISAFNISRHVLRKAVSPLL